MKRLMLLMQTVLQECGTRCGISTEFDWKTIERRVEHEGLEFLTITLPNLCKEFERALDQRQASLADWTGWSTRGTTPVFLGQFFDLVFDRDSGRLVEDLLSETPPLHPEDTFSERELASLKLNFGVGNFDKTFPEFGESHKAQRRNAIEAIVCVRQITRLFSKLEVEAAESRVDMAFEDFLNCERDLTTYLSNGVEAEELGFAQISRLLYGKIFFELSKRAVRGLSDTEAWSWLDS
jgi:hypothetical protein